MPHPSRAHLDAIGITVWVRRGVARIARPVEATTGATPGDETAMVRPAAATRGDRGTDRSPVDVARSARPVEGPRGAVEGPAVTAGATAEPSPAPRASHVETPPASPATPLPAARLLESIHAQVRDCRKCELHRTRTHTVFGTGRPDAACMFIGEAPGAEEDARGEPFVGRAGKLLDAMLAAIGLARGDVYIANIVKCRPPRNRDPRTDEIAACSGYLRRQIETVSPRLLVAAGRIAVQSLLSTTEPVGRLRGRTFRYGEDGLPVMVMYHPAYFLRSPLEKRKAWEDLVRLRSMLLEQAASAP